MKCNYSWIRKNIFIKENAKIGNNSVIEVNSAVVKDIPSHSLAIGIPAKISFKNDNI